VREAAGAVPEPPLNGRQLGQADAEAVSTQ
jgi:hypothetical protein